ncbi:MAG: hypothetical protein UV42_C0024G0009 [Candidatus Magasanikbacteria bacterium GW2011_GWE2_42_7]|uniref:DUF3494 domain-containing protein n=1 Tax=Candidatus Magasanikbacteria bacterium GW2011_GWE2_42_7 TaxID=1619052 RepID=A0A0G1BE77_9BACT|nr:MAG: hypothetical protein UV42_C0024G0009 [Candidatus Magasanikbacteria bacterium GW2011_GWE2_42_7]
MKKGNKLSIAIALVVFFMFTALPGTTVAAGPTAVHLGSASDFVILAKSGISTTGATSVVGDIGVSPISATAMTGFGLIMDASNIFSTSAVLTGKAYAADYMTPTPANMTTAVSNMETAYTDAAGRTNPIETELGAGNIGGMTLAPGLYKWSTGVTIPTDLTLSGGANDVWIFQIAQNLTISSAMKIVLSGGAQASNVFWQVAGQTTLGTNAEFSGNILGQTAIVLNTGAVLNGRALSQTAVTLDANIVSVPTLSVVTPTNGSCSPTHYSCTIGTSTSNVSSTTAWTWSCTGTDGGTDASCSETKSSTPTPTPTPTLTPTPTNGSCSDTHYSCIVGTSTSNVSGTTAWTWSCTGVDGGTDASCSETKSSTPTPTPTLSPTSEATVVPSLPNTGILSNESNIPWYVIISSGLFVALFSLYLVRRKQVNN